MTASDNEIKVRVKKHNWWWRNPNADWSFDPISHTTSLLPGSASEWKDGQERAAWRYEVLRRASPEARKQLKPFIKLKRDAKMALEADFANHRDHEIVRPPLGVGIKWDNERWFLIADKGWNLDAPDNFLAAEFLKLIHRERKARGIGSPKNSDWNKEKSPSWLWPELLDLSDSEKLSDRFSVSEGKLYERASALAQSLMGYWNDLARANML